MNQEGLALKSNDKLITINKENIKHIDLFRSNKSFCMRVLLESDVYDILNVHESFLNKIRSLVSQHYGVPISNTELETLDTVEGDLMYSNNVLHFSSQKQIFSIPKNAIKRVIDLENDLQFDLGDLEIVFNTTSNISEFLSNKVAEETCIINNVTCINPRSKSCLVFFSDYMVVKGSSYDHLILYSNITEIFYLKKDDQSYLILKLENCVIQGQTKYEALVFLLHSKELEVVAKDSRLKSYYKGEQGEVILEILESLVKIKAQESTKFFKCTNKINDGFLYLLNNSLQFLPKAISIYLDEISSVDFSRVNLSVAQAKTFDMTVLTVSNKSYNFNGISKEAFNEIEDFFRSNGINMNLEVIEDSVSSGDSESEDDDSSNLSGIIGSDE